MTPQKLAVTVAAGTMLGVVPALGLTTVMATAVAARFRLNIAATVLISYLVQPLQLLLVVPYIKLGVFMFGLQEQGLSVTGMVAMFKADWQAALSKLWLINLAGISAWALLALPAGGVLYLLTLPLFKRVVPQQATRMQHVS